MTQTSEVPTVKAVDCCTNLSCSTGMGALWRPTLLFRTLDSVQATQRIQLPAIVMCGPCALITKVDHLLTDWTWSFIVERFKRQKLIEPVRDGALIEFNLIRD